MNDRMRRNEGAYCVRENADVIAGRRRELERRELEVRELEVRELEVREHVDASERRRGVNPLLDLALMRTL